MEAVMILKLIGGGIALIGIIGLLVRELFIKPNKEIAKEKKHG